MSKHIRKTRRVRAIPYICEKTREEAIAMVEGLQRSFLKRSGLEAGQLEVKTGDYALVEIPNVWSLAVVLLGNPLEDGYFVVKNVVCAWCDTPLEEVDWYALDALRTSVFPDHSWSCFPVVPYPLKIPVVVELGKLWPTQIDVAFERDRRRNRDKAAMDFIWEYAK